VKFINAFRASSFIAVALFPALIGATESEQIIPLTTADHWQQLSYSSIKSNVVSYTADGLLIHVDQSASPLIFPFEHAENIDEVSVSIAIKGDIHLTEAMQGEKGADDFVFRLGLVSEGNKTLNVFQRSIAAKWIKTLYTLAPEGAGIDNIAFYSVYSDNRLHAKSRVHPLSNLIVEHYVEKLPEKGELEFTFKPKSSARVLALWLSSDGDDTHSTYDVLIKKIVIKKHD
jgi:hypothetical protein